MTGACLDLKQIAFSSHDRHSLSQVVCFNRHIVGRPVFVQCSNCMTDLLKRRGQRRPCISPARPLAHNGNRLRRPGYRRIEPALAVLAESVAFVEQHDIAPLRPLRLVHGQRIAEVEGVVPPPLRPGDLLLRPFRSGFRT